jgi:streptomycin 6-kinase
VSEVQPTFRAFVARRFGNEGRAWLATLPALEQELASAWGLELGEELAGGTLSRVVAAGADAVLKLGGPWDRVEDEIACLERWHGDGAPRLLRADPAHHALLLERIRPGTRAVDADPAAVGALLRLLHVEPPAGLSALADVAGRRVERALADGRTTAAKADWARAKIAELTQDPPEPRLLHGDFDERNLLVCARQGLAAIDPLPCAGDPAYDAGYWAHANRRPGRRARTTAIAAALGLPVERVRGWCAVVAVHG